MFTASDYREWAAQELKDYSDFAECVEYVNQSDDYGDCLRGDWYAADPDNLVVYYGTFGNDHSPGASHYTYADKFESKEDYDECVARWESYPEYLSRDEEDMIDLSDEAHPEGWDHL